MSDKILQLMLNHERFNDRYHSAIVPYAYGGSYVRMAKTRISFAHTFGFEQNIHEVY